MKKIDYDHKPSVLKAIGNGSWFYRWDIEENEAFAMSESMYTGQGSDDAQAVEAAPPHFLCHEVIINEPLTANKITQAVMNALWGDGVEQKLINDYQSAQLGLLDDKYTEKYEQFLADRIAVKEEIDRVCKENGIPA